MKSSRDGLMRRLVIDGCWTGWTDVLVSAQALGPKWVRINRRMEAGGMIDSLASTRAEGWLEGRLRDWAGDDKCFMFVSLNMR